MNDREEFIEKAKAELDKLDATIDRFERDVEKLSANVEIKRQEALKVVRQKQADVENRIRKFRDADEAAKDEMSDGLETAWKELNDTFEQVREHYSSKDAS